MRRRRFLGLAGLGIGALPAALRSAARPRKVIVLGAGLAGLAAADELARAGHEVLVLEARDRPGGRVRTLRHPFVDGQYADAGATFVPRDHSLTLRYAARLGLSVEPALPPFEARLTYVRGRRLVTNWSGDIDWPYALAPEDRRLGYRGLWQKYVTSALAGQRAADLDRLSAADFLRLHGASPETMALLRVGYLDMLGDGVESYSALQMRERLAAASAERLVIAGGTDLLPGALAAQLEGRIRYRAPVVRIEQDAAQAAVVVSGEKAERLAAERVICTLPFAVLKGVEVAPSFSPAKREAIDKLSYTSVLRVFLQFRRRRWTAENLYLLATTDRPMRWIFDHTAHQKGERGILEAQALGADARRLAALPEAARIAFALAELERVFPGLAADYERGVTKDWDADPWARGAFAYYRPGQMLAFAPHLASAEGRIHFAGEHTSGHAGWMQGALESGLRAAQEVMEAA